MQLAELLQDKNIKPKDKTTSISEWILCGELPVDELMAFAEKQKDAAKATCIEALEFATRQNPKLAHESLLSFVTESLAAKAPRLKWESAKVIGNIAHLFPDALDTAVEKLLQNTRHEGTVVRWSAAFALSEILLVNHVRNKILIQQLQEICAAEEKNSIRNIYLKALKKMGKQ